MQNTSVFAQLWRNSNRIDVIICYNMNASSDFFTSGVSGVTSKITIASSNDRDLHRTVN